MRFGFVVPNFDDYADPRLLADLAREAEAAGWDGFFLWDHLVWPGARLVTDAWTALALIAAETSVVRFGPIVTPIPRRRPWKLARETVALDRLSGGRLVLGVGLGGFREEFDDIGEEPDPKVRAQQLDEGLEVLVGLWSGRPFSHRGRHFRIEEARFEPTPVQSPRIPIWVAATWPRPAPIRRAARWDGVVPVRERLAPMTPADVRGIVEAIRAERRVDDPFEVVIGGATSGRDAARDAEVVGAFAAAGVTWWNEGRLPWRSTLEEVRERIRLGPPHVGG